MMTNYVLVYTGGGMPESEEEQAAEMAAWGAWYEGMGAALVDGGNPFGPVKSISSDGRVSDEPVGARASGYTIIAADSMEEACSHAQGCPNIKRGGQVAVYETFNM